MRFTRLGVLGSRAHPHGGIPCLSSRTASAILLSLGSSRLEQVLMREMQGNRVGARTLSTSTEGEQRTIGQIVGIDTRVTWYPGHMKKAYDALQVN
jgi:hypothetical protein